MQGAVLLAAQPLRVKLLWSNNSSTGNPSATAGAGNPSLMAAAGPKWAQKTVTLPPHRRGCHLITPKIMKEIGKDLSEFKCGLAHIFLQHTSASLTINENYDSDVRSDTETFLNNIVPEVSLLSASIICNSHLSKLCFSLPLFHLGVCLQGTSAPWKHTLEGPDDMPAHIKSSMFGCALTVPITNGKFNMGTWQGIWLCEHRDHPTARNIVVTLNGI
ncbi:yjbQ [Cucurbita argyrosperma subsp. argyrosperma]|nr:yjbQ [Cucurbita argyrosperma subsp. argyrosperma]